MTKKIEGPEADDVLKGILGEGRTAVTECLQWIWIEAWDSEIVKKSATGEDTKDLKEVLKKKPDCLEDLSKLKFVSDFRDQWEVLGTENNNEIKWRIRRTRPEPDKKTEDSKSNDRL